MARRSMIARCSGKLMSPLGHGHLFARNRGHEQSQFVSLDDTAAATIPRAQMEKDTLEAEAKRGVWRCSAAMVRRAMRSPGNGIEQRVAAGVASHARPATASTTTTLHCPRRPRWRPPAHPFALMKGETLHVWATTARRRPTAWPTAGFGAANFRAISRAVKRAEVAVTAAEARFEDELRRVLRDRGIDTPPRFSEALAIASGK
jgi:hypothetical protein